MANYVREDFEFLKVMRFSISEIECAIAIMEVREVIPPPDIRHIPKAPGFVEGVFSLRGEIIPVVDLRKLFGVEPKSADFKVILRQIKEVTIGYMVDQVNNVMQVERSQIKPPPPVIIKGLDKGCLYGLFDYNDENIILMDLSKAMAPGEVAQIGNLLKQL
ncbi:MAG: hypothetical protein A2527_10860 [Candidatus Lambdaproteobacteria bacterium RIFOXYD2_FULL_50_16]|uniref:CheW-like domain-containing protein n=1 Tax=Candidatus Lambdaproteobacteria bacterium RIFOXYD2_FULL_50_16 TaxID=1817772 RepID=A0A1F6GGC6_9PROT|nr:MAG: hypothetical protein A2527_10860 [Candidatus Lambdaproteobacteria bacterium RIFOXYD2_FULL_50_16]